MTTDITAGPSVRTAGLAPTAPRDRECLPCYLQRMIGRFRCDNRLRWAEYWARGNQLPGLLRWLRANGGYCDCEVLFNVYSDLSDADDGVAHRPPCRGVARGVRDPCQSWRRCGRA